MMPMARTRKMWFMAPLALLGFALFVMIGGLVVMGLWNAVLTTVFGWPALGFWQALGLLLLCRILIGGMGFPGMRRPHRARPPFERWRSMTPEDRERFRHGMRGRCGFGPTGGHGSQADAESVDPR